jgi:nucleoside phosphorylase
MAERDNTLSADIAVLVPLKEEFRVFFAEIKSYIRASDKRNGRTFHFFDWNGIRCVTAMVGDPGETKAGLVALDLVKEFNATHLVVMGIAGALENDLRVGDVVVATVVDRYLENSKAQDSPDGGFKLIPSGECYRPNAIILNRIKNFEFDEQEAFLEWQKAAAIARLPNGATVPIQSPHIRNNPTLYEGHIASGSSVSGADAFKAWLKSRDRKYQAVEMESGGVAEVLHETAFRGDWTIIRGISDLADGAKKSLDDGDLKANVPAGFFREYAMRNAVALLERLVKHSVFHHEFAVATVHKLEWPKANLPAVTNLESALLALRSPPFRFGWEQTSFAPGPEFVVYWPVTLRQPTPIHAVQTFAAAVLQRFGGKIKLCLDDLGNRSSTPQVFCSAVERWLNRVGGNYDQIEIRTFSEFLNDNLDAWPVMQTWLGKTNDRMQQILEISKILEGESNSEVTAIALKERKPRRLLTPATVWSVLAAVRKNTGQLPLVTLGGVDEKPLWKSWRNSICTDERIGHLYNRRLGKEKPVHMEVTKLGWDSRDDVVAALSKSFAEDVPLDDDSLLNWTLHGCVQLPQFVKSDCTSLDHIELPTSLQEAQQRTHEFADLVSKWLF